MSKNRVTSPFDSEMFLSKVGQGKTIVRYRSKQIIFSQDDEADAVYYLQKGQIKIAVVSDRGQAGIIAILYDKSFFGEECLAGQSRQMASAEAMTDCAVMRLEKHAIISVLRDQPEFSTLFISHLLSRNIRIQEDLVDQLFNSSEKRLARVLLLLANYGKETRPEAVIPKVSQEVLAEMIGTTRSRVSYFMNKFRKLGFIDYDDGLHVRSSLLNIVLHD